MRNRIKLFNYPFLNAGVTFKADELNLRAEKFITEVKAKGNSHIRFLLQEA